MPFCTIVEFEWSDEAERDRFQTAAGAADAPSRVTGFDVTSYVVA